MSGGLTTWRAAMAAAILATIGQVRWWLVAMATFLVRGGLLLLLPPLLVLPTPAELASLVPASLVGTGLAHPTAALVTLVAGVSLGLVAVVFVTTAIGTWLDLGLVAEQAADGELGVLGPPDGVQRVLLWPAMEVRLLAHVPTAIAASLGLVVLGNALQAELISPPGPLPLALRVLLREPLMTAAIVGAWLLGEAWGSLALRRLATSSPGSTLRALRLGLADVLRPSGLATLLLTSTVIGAVVALLWATAGRAFERLWPLVIEPSDDGLLLLALGLFVGTWAAGLWLVAIALAWRSAAWTAEVLRRS
ncbi:MAG: hypothetical protein HY263_09530 [Chloroflexi bacterium]|nr:hypothetical protein [Chloroflexota bacterium]